jgi:beta-glucanase (GH16 family)
MSRTGPVRKSSTATVLAVGAVVLGIAAAGASRLSPANIDVPGSHGSPALMWSDEFSGPQGAPPDASRWNLETGADWSDGELQCYTSSPDNTNQDGAGNLVISARHVPGHRCDDGRMADYTSARMTSRYEAAGGTLAVRAALPTARGTWPAVWALGSNYPAVGWPAAGELDLAEGNGKRPTAVGVHLHGPGYSGASALGAMHQLDGDAPSFHVYSVTWTQDTVDFFIDGGHVWGTTASDMPRGGRWVLDHSFFAVLNLAIGGGLAGPPDATTDWPQQMVIDYVRFFA